jgi:hypothetical protein
MGILTQRCAWMRALLIGSALAIGAHAAGVEPAVSKEYQIKAAFIFNFVKFVEWPETAFANANDPIHIGVLGEDPLGTALDQIVKGEKIHDRRLVVERSNNVEDLKNCHLLFISRSERTKVKDIITNLGQVPVLTVSDIEGFAGNGGAIRLYLEDNKVRFEINPSIAKKLNLKMSSQLLNLGKIVEP